MVGTGKYLSRRNEAYSLAKPGPFFLVSPLVTCYYLQMNAVKSVPCASMVRDSWWPAASALRGRMSKWPS